jgi:hypothetical protein
MPSDHIVPQLPRESVCPDDEARLLEPFPVVPAVHPDVVIRIKEANAFFGRHHLAALECLRALRV